MTQPDNFGFGEEAALLKESARKFFADNFPTEKLHGMVASDPNPERMTDCCWDQDLWQQMVDLGWTALAVPESAGGVGMPAVAVAGLAEELGRAAFPCPLLPTFNATYVLAACGSAADGPLAEIAEGPRPPWRLPTARDPGNSPDTEVTVAAWQADWHSLVCAGCAQGRSSAGERREPMRTGALLGREPMPPALTMHPDAIIDLTRDQAHIQL